MKKLLTGLALLALAGCMQFERVADGSAYYNHPDGVHVYGHPYKATKHAYNYWFLAPARLYGWWGLDTHDPIGAAYATFFWPLSIIDVPCEAVIDTVMLIPDCLLAR